MDILLILGSVTARQYEPLRLAMLQRGLKPKIVRLPSEPRKPSDLFNHLLIEWETSNGPVTEEKEDEFDSWVNTRTEELLDTTISEVFKGSSTEEVKALLYPIDATVSSDWAWMSEYIPKSVGCYQVMRSESDMSEYLLGAGFGESLDIKK